MKKCSQCGEENKDDSRFCQNCGASLNQSSKRSKGNLIDRYKNSSMFVKIIIIVVIAYFVLFVATYGAHIFFGIPIELYTEAEETDNPQEFNIVDIDGDGAISYYEIKNLDLDISDDDLESIFDRSDKNDNGLLIGSEFDGFLHKLQKHYQDLEKQEIAKQKAEKEKQEKKSNSQYTAQEYKMMNTYTEGKCPECGSDESYIYQYYDKNGEPYYSCTVCDYTTYDYSDFY